MQSGSKEHDTIAEPVLSAESFLEHSLSSETEAALQEFANIWNNCKGARLPIERFLANKHLVPLATEANTRNNQPVTNQAKSNAVELLIDKGLLSSDKITSGLNISFGGLSRKKVLLLLDRHKAGKRSLGAYLLIRAWKKENRYSSSISQRLKQITIRSVSQAITENRSDFFRDIANSIDFLRKEEYEENNHWDHDPGQWWQFHLLLYILENPKTKYPIRDFVRHFREEVGENEMPTTKTIRSFCRANAIALDSTPGAPRKSPKPDEL